MRKIFRNGFYTFLLFCCLQPWCGCNVINPHEPTPTYVHIDSFHFTGNSSYPKNTTSHQITTVWAYYNNNLIGEFDLPCTIPVVTTGDTGTLQLAPGIMVNGLNSDVTPYPFYTLDTSRLPTMPGKVVTHTPVTKFAAGLDISPISNFESSIDFVPLSGTIPLTNVSDDSLVFEGFQSGSILLGPSDSAINGSRQTILITYGAHAFIEFNYKSDVPFFVGLRSNESTLGSSTPYYIAGVAPSSTWKKFYLNVEPFVLNFRGTDYNFYVKASLPDGGTRGRVLLDNIQRVMFK